MQLTLLPSSASAPSLGWQCSAVRPARRLCLLGEQKVGPVFALARTRSQRASTTQQQHLFRAFTVHVAVASHCIIHCAPSLPLLRPLRPCINCIHMTDDVGLVWWQSEKEKWSRGVHSNDILFDGDCFGSRHSTQTHTARSRRSRSLL